MIVVRQFARLDTTEMQAALYYNRKKRRALLGGLDVPGGDGALMDFSDGDNAEMNIAE